MATDGASTLAAVVPSEQRLDRDWGLALNEASLYLKEKSAVQDSLRRIVQRLKAIGVKFVVVGGPALVWHGLGRFTDDDSLLETPESLKTIHNRLGGLGYVSPFTASKQLRDADNGVRIEFLVTGAFPGDGKFQPVAFPDPADVGVVLDGNRYITRPRLIELKLASGMTGGPLRMKDFADVIALIQARTLTREFAAALNPHVADKECELWQGIQDSPARPGFD